MADQPDSIPTRVALLEQIAQATVQRLDRIDTRLDRLESREADDFRYLVRLQITLAALTIGLMLAGFTSLGSLMAHGFRWF